MEKVVETYIDKNNNNNKRRISHAMSQQESKTTIATSKKQQQKQKQKQQSQQYYTQSKIYKIYNNKRNEENSGQKQQQKKQKSKQRNKPKTAQQQIQQKQYEYHAQNANAKATTKKQKQQSKQKQQLTPTVDYFRFSALYALVATSAKAAKHSMRRYALATYVDYDNEGDDEDEDEAESEDEDDSGDVGEGVKAAHHHNLQQRHLRTPPPHCAQSVLELKRHCRGASLTHTHLSKLWRTICHRSDSGVNCVRQIPNGIVDLSVDTQRRVTSCGFFSASSGGSALVGSTTGNGTSYIVGVGGLDTRSIFYLTLLLFIYCGIMMRASVAATAIANATMYNNSTHTTNTNETNAPIINTATLTAYGSFLHSNFSTPIEDATNNNNTIQDGLAATSTPTNSINSTPQHAQPPTPDTNINGTSNNSSQRYVSLVGATHVTFPALVVNANESVVDIQSVVKRDTAHVPDDDDDSAYHDDEFDEYEALINNRSAKGKYIGAPCFSDFTCESSLVHVTCDKETNICGCERNHPVQLGLTKGCAKPKKLGEQCFYDETCIYNDENSLCVQVRHNAMCQCAHGFHSVSHTKPTRRIFCTKDLKELNSDLTTLLGVTTGIAVLGGLICMVLHLFTKTKYPRPRNFGDANLPPPIMYSSETGIPLTVQSGRPSSRSSLRSSASIGSYGNRRASSGGGAAGGAGGRHGGMDGLSGIVGGGSSTGGTKGILVSTSRTGAARSAAILLISCHLTELAKEAATIRTTTTSRQTSGAGCSANSRDNLDDNGSGGGTYAGGTTGGSGSRSCDSTLSMTRHLQKQLNHQRHLLSLELSPAKTKNNERIRALLGINGIDNYRTDDDDELNSLDHNHLQIGALPTPASETPRFAKHKGKESQKQPTLHKKVALQLKNQTEKQYGGDYVPSKQSSRRPSLASVHSTSSSVRSYSMMRFEKEAQQKEIRQEMKLRLARLQHQQHLNQNKPQIVIGDTLQHHMGAGSALNRLAGMPTPSPLTPNSTDELLPSVDELQEYPPKSEDLAITIHRMAADSVAASTLTAIKQATAVSSLALTTTTMGASTTATSGGASSSGGLVTPVTPSDTAGAAGYLGPCSSSTEAL